MAVKEDQEKELLKNLCENLQMLDKEAYKGLTNKLKSLEDGFQFLRVHVKYLLFDNEALRRENEYLQKVIADLAENGDQNP